ncbi:metalloregulator ArsR/SmtB family transcription factor [Shouchella sp. JSM 1781072]|uniref:DUF2087 domain-containing protein n=1 Tax=Bacillaceae TaxID=186817 RepID=UPI000C077AAD|nr:MULTISPECIES: metalloregulator ArsR/SmtB family transcription factor [Bacillaceae]UTR05894.1 metalloregulator ArsR/SmtB family transcription factor [Alkalihalobacillus sp. LMS6]
MQLSRMVHFHKTVGDKTRIQIISMLKTGPLHNGAIAGKLGLTPPTISHHLTKLKEIDVIYQRREKNTIYFHLNETKLKQMAEAIIRIGGDNRFEYFDVSNEDKAFVRKHFFNRDGALMQLPAQRKKRLIILEVLAQQFDEGRQYEETEVNEILKGFHEDFATIRRELIMSHFMYRHDQLYELNPKEMWPV